MYDMEYEVRSKCTTLRMKLDRNIRHGVRNKNEMNDLDFKLVRNLSHGVRNMNEMNDLE